MFDLLANSLTHPLLMLFDVTVKQQLLIPKITFVSMGLKDGCKFTLVDKRDFKVCRVQIPSMLAVMPRDVALSIDCSLQIIEWY